jgi:subtilisin family serine protease
LELIVKTKSLLSQAEVEAIKSTGSNLIFVSKYYPIIIVKSNNPSAFHHFSFVERIRLARIGKYSTEGNFLNNVIFRPMIQATLLKKNGYVGWGAKVAVLDSGLPLGLNVAKIMDFTGTGSTDRFGHGTFVTNIIKYYSQGAKLLIGKIGNDYPSEVFLIMALEWAVDEGADVINISSGFGSKCIGNCELGMLIDTIVNNTGIAIIVAAGNNGPHYNSIQCPACASNATSVGAIDVFGKLASYSSRGRTCSRKPNILAPGDVIIDGKHANGTSYAAPIISGILAATKNKHDNIQQAVQTMYDTAESLGLPFNEQGAGIFNLEKYLGVIEYGRSNSKGEGQN